jgi:hypothetical protein
MRYKLNASDAEYIDEDRQLRLFLLSKNYFQMSVIGSAARSPSAKGSIAKLSSMVRRTL